MSTPMDWTPESMEIDRSEQSASRLFNMPQELRDNIYKNVFDGNPGNLALLQTCMRVYNEAGLLAFRRTAFSMDFDFPELGYPVLSILPERLFRLSEAQTSSITTIDLSETVWRNEPGMPSQIMDLFKSDILPSLDSIRSRGVACPFHVINYFMWAAAKEANFDLVGHNASLHPWADDLMYTRDLTKTEFEKVVPAGTKLFSVEKIGDDWLFKDHRVAVEDLKAPGAKERGFTVAMNTDTPLADYISVFVIHRSA